MNRRRAFRIVSLTVALSAVANVFALGQPNAKQLKDYLANLPFTMPDMKEPRFPERTLNIIDFGAIGDGHTLNTKAINDAIQSCARAGGGSVIVPPGTWLTGPIRMENNINLQVVKGALIQFSSNIGDYPFIAGLDGNSRRYIITPPIHAYRKTNIAITGEGIIDGAGEVWRYVKKIDMTDGQWKTLTESGGVVTADGQQWWPSKQALEGEEHIREIEKLSRALTAADYEETREYLRPNLVSFVECNNVLFEGTTFENSPKFHLYPVRCQNLIIRNIKVLAPEYGQNTDGIDLGSCRNVVLYNCTVSVGDDGICLKPAPLAAGQAPGASCSNIVIADCVVYKAHGGFVIGSGTAGGVRNVSVRNCVYAGTDVGLRFKSARDRGGVVENIFFDGIQMRDIKTDAILFDMYYSGGAPEAEATKDLTVRKAEPVTALTPQFRDFFVNNVVCNGADRAVVINGLPEMSIKNMVLKNVSVSSRRGAFIADADGVQLNDCRIVPQTGPIISIIQSRNVTVSGGHYPVDSEVFVRVDGEQSGDIRLVGLDLKKARKAVERGPTVKIDAVRQE